MATIDHPSEGKAECIALVEQEIAAAREQRRPMSRQGLASLVQKRTGMPAKDALAIVAAFCDEKEPALPEFLESEFVIGWLKVVAGALVLLGGGFYWEAQEAHRRGNAYWPWIFLGTVFVLTAVFSWVKSLEKEVEIR